ncbi:MAG: hypothetical protein CVV42_06050 [Candidatus Riflebacteria bacterium HGW-Riflebacteria-2]|jgi:hypothetical protein|nr:MAG: hypothetical protein CVV42_06050 [Candidatus Riflebacteria bacterium HGW-Riflebacteria-2]
MKAGSLLCFFLILSVAALAQVSSDLEIRQPARSYGQLIQVPAYSFVYSYEKGRQFNLAVTLSIRNTDLSRNIMVESVKYIDVNGQVIKDHLLKQSVNLKPGACIQYLINESDPAGGSGPSFIVRWRAEQAVYQPIVETVMIGTKSQQGISFTSSGRVLEELLPMVVNPDPSGNQQR